MRLFTLDHPTDTDDWYTPPWIFEDMGVTFDVDVAAPVGGVPWIPAIEYYSPDDDGLSQEWNGFVWCNPPYSAPFAWCDKWAAHRNGIIVLRADLSTRGPAAAFASATSLFVPTPRLQFVNGHSETANAVNFSTLLFAAGDRADAALSRFPLTRGIYRTLT